jgi:hypothetical protein
LAVKTADIVSSIRVRGQCDGLIGGGEVWKKIRIRASVPMPLSATFEAGRRPDECNAITFRSPITDEALMCLDRFVTVQP